MLGPCYCKLLVLLHRGKAVISNFFVVSAAILELLWEESHAANHGAMQAGGIHEGAVQWVTFVSSLMVWHTMLSLLFYVCEMEIIYISLWTPGGRLDAWGEAGRLGGDWMPGGRLDSTVMSLHKHSPSAQPNALFKASSGCSIWRRWRVFE